MIDHYDIFISYSSKDSKIAHEIVEKLRKTMLSCFIAEVDINLTDQWQNKIHDAIYSSKIVLFLITHNTINSDWIKVEAGAAWALNKKIVPMLIDVKEDHLIDVLRQFQVRYVESSEQIDQVVNDVSAIIDFTAFWKCFLSEKKPEANVYVLLSSKIGVDYAKGKATGKKGHTVLVSFNEFDAALRLQRELGDLRNNLRIVKGGVKIGSNEDDIDISEFPKGENLILFGSTHANLTCEEIMNHINPPYQFRSTKNKEADKYIFTKNGRFPKENEHIEIDDGDFSEITKDYGILLRITNPLDRENKNKVLILAGNHGYGTQAAINFISEPKYIKVLRNEVGDKDFEALFVSTFMKKQLIDLQLLKISIFEYGKWKMEITM